MISGSTSARPSGLALIASIRLLRRSSSISRWPCVVALKSTRLMMPLSSGFALAISWRYVVSCSPILSDSVRMTDQTGSSGFFGSSGRKKRTSFLSCLTSLNALAREPTSFAIRSSSSSKTSQSRLAKISGRMNSLYLGASFAPRIEHAASQIHDSRDLLLFEFVAINLPNFWEDLQIQILVKLRIARPRYTRMFALRSLIFSTTDLSDAEVIVINLHVAVVAALGPENV